ncbi:hypothetical protein D3C72_1645280 [compost metagenome]
MLRCSASCATSPNLRRHTSHARAVSPSARPALSSCSASPPMPWLCNSAMMRLLPKRAERRWISDSEKRSCDSQLACSRLSSKASTSSPSCAWRCSLRRNSMRLCSRIDKKRSALPFRLSCTAAIHPPCLSFHDHIPQTQSPPGATARDGDQGPTLRQAMRRSDQAPWAVIRQHCWRL